MQALTFRILLTLRSEAADGGTILERLRLLGEGRPPSLPTLYRCLREAIERGWIEIAGADESDGPGRPRQVYALTETGAAAAREEAERMRDLAGLILDDAGLDGRGKR